MVPKFQVTVAWLFPRVLDTKLFHILLSMLPDRRVSRYVGEASCLVGPTSRTFWCHRSDQTRFLFTYT